MYKITNSCDGKIYIGSSVDTDKRKREYFDKSPTTSRKLRAFDVLVRTNPQNFKFEVIERVKFLNDHQALKASLVKREQYWLDTLQPYNDIGYNICKKVTSSYNIKRKKGFYTLRNKNKEIILVTNLTRFAFDNNLSISALFMLVRGFIITYEGYTCPDFDNLLCKTCGTRISKQAKKDLCIPCYAVASQGKEFCLISPEGKEYKGHCVSILARKEGLNPSALSAIIKGNGLSYKGWTVKGGRKRKRMLLKIKETPNVQ